MIFRIGSFINSPSINPTTPAKSGTSNKEIMLFGNSPKTNVFNTNKLNDDLLPQEKLREERARDDDGDIVKKFFNKDNQMVKQNHYKDHGDFSGHEEYTYAKNGKLAGEKFFNEKGKLYKALEYSYDEKNNSTTIIRKDGDGNIEMVKEQFVDESGKIEKEFIKNIKGENKILLKYDYDEQGNVIMSKSFYPDGKEMSLPDYYKIMLEINN